jgi:hypothetical protein
MSSEIHDTSSITFEEDNFNSVDLLLSITPSSNRDNRHSSIIRGTLDYVSTIHNFSDSVQQSNNLRDATWLFYIINTTLIKYLIYNLPDIKTMQSQQSEQFMNFLGPYLNNLHLKLDENIRWAKSNYQNNNKEADELRKIQREYDFVLSTQKLQLSKYEADLNLKNQTIVKLEEEKRELQKKYEVARQALRDASQNPRTLETDDTDILNTDNSDTDEQTNENKINNIFETALINAEHLLYSVEEKTETLSNNSKLKIWIKTTRRQIDKLKMEYLDKSSSLEKRLESLKSILDVVKSIEEKLNQLSTV